MGLCRYCNAKAGLFKDAHELCSQDAAAAVSELCSLVTSAVADRKTAGELMPVLEEVHRKGRLGLADTRMTLLQAADKATLARAREAPVSVQESDRIGEIFKALEPTWFDNPTKLVNWQGYLSLIYSATLHQILHGQVPYCNPSLYEAFRLQRDQHPILKRGATLGEYRTVSSGNAFESVGVPLGGGVYYRVGSSALRTKQTGLVPIAQGLMLISTKAIYFSGEQMNFRLPYKSILRLEYFPDAIGVYENHGRGKVFIPNKLGEMDEGWYFYNLISALASQEL